MGSFAWGLIIGLLTSGIIAAVVMMYGYRRVLRLERRALNAERMAELGLLTGGLAHEIKNPLSTVQLNLQLLQEDLEPQAQSNTRVVNRLNTVQKEVLRLRDILDDFLRYAGKLELDRKPVDVNELLEELVDFLMPQAQQQRVQLRLRKSDQRIMAPVDARLLKQAVMNLMLNGLQAMGDGGGELILNASLNGTNVLIDVADTGKGIPADDIDKIFQAYYSKRKGGTGLGLAMAKRIVEEHGGQLTVRSTMGQGADFTICIPAVGKRSGVTGPQI